LHALRRIVQNTPPKLLPIAQSIDHLNERIGQGTLWLVLAMMGLGVWNVIGRYIGRAIGQNLTSNALLESQWYIFDLLFLLGAAYTLKHDEHVRVDIFYAGWPPRRKALADLLGTLFFLIPFCVMVMVASWQTIARSWLIWETSPDPGGLARYPIKTMILVSLLLLILQGVANAIKNWAILTGHLNPQSESRESEI
jgi:TRAP-type mannitol/chloroaromatic compound transport system permease small subunit